MTTHQDRNPFTGAEQLSFADLIRLTEMDEDLSWPGKREICSALRSIAKWTDRRPEELPANAEFIRRALEKFHPAHQGVGKRRVQNAVALVKRAMRRYGIISNKASYLVELNADWRALWKKLPSSYHKSALSRLVRFCCAQGIAPNVVDGQTDSNVTRHTLHPIWEAAIEHINTALWEFRSGLLPERIIEIEKAAHLESMFALVEGLSANIAATLGLDETAAIEEIPEILEATIGNRIDANSDHFLVRVEKSRDRYRFLST